MLGTVALILLGLGLAAYFFGRSRALVLAGGEISSLHSRPVYHGLYSAVWTLLLGIIVFLILSFALDGVVDRQLYSKLPDEMRSIPAIQQDRIIEDAKLIAQGKRVAFAANERVAAVREAIAKEYDTWSIIRNWAVALGSIGIALITFLLTYRQLTQRLRTRNRFEAVVRTFLLVSAAIAIMTTVGILLSLIGETLVFFKKIDWRIDKFLFGTHWSPLSGVFEGALDNNSVGAVPLFAGTFLITLIAMLVAVPVGLMAAIYLSEYASLKVRSWAKPLLEILAGIPTVVYGFFAAITIAPMFRGAGESIGLSVASESALAAGIVMGIMIIPFISSLSDDVINAVPQALRDGSFGLGATKAETITKVVFPAALPGIVSAVLLGISRAVGETMIVVMAAGQGANLTWNPLEAVTTVTVQIVALITGDTEADTAAGPAFALGFTLFCMTLLLNVIALRIVQKYRERYD